jgi:hypothetical protein
MPKIGTAVGVERRHWKTCSFNLEYFMALQRCLGCWVPRKKDSVGLLVTVISVPAEAAHHHSGFLPYRREPSVMQDRSVIAK